jgi:hypothetical protein
MRAIADNITFAISELYSMADNKEWKKVYYHYVNELAMFISHIHHFGETEINFEHGHIRARVIIKMDRDYLYNAVVIPVSPRD